MRLGRLHFRLRWGRKVFEHIHAEGLDVVVEFVHNCLEPTYICIMVDGGGAFAFVELKN